MAGAYDDAPSRRMAWDADKSVVMSACQESMPNVSVGGNPPGAWGVVSQGARDNGNDEDNTTNLLRCPGGGTGFDPGMMIGFLFPEGRELDAVYIDRQGSTGFTNWWVAHSTDTKSLNDGTWNQSFSSPTPDSSASQTDYRDVSKMGEAIVSNIVGMKVFLRSTTGSEVVYCRAIHIYGTISPSETPDRLLYLDPDNLDIEFSKPLDWGDVPRDATKQDTFKIKNNSGSLTANTNQVSAEELTGDDSGFYTFSDDDVSYSATLSLGNLGPGADSGTIYVRQTIGAAEPILLGAPRFKVNTASWS